MQFLCRQLAAVKTSPRPRAGRVLFTSRFAPIAVASTLSYHPLMNCSCGADFASAEYRDHRVWRCTGCGDLFVPTESLARLLSNLTRSFDDDGLKALRAQCRERIENLVGSNVKVELRVYQDCPVCHATMTRRSFAPGSGIVVHQCVSHGSLGRFNWLKQAEEFITRGGEMLVLTDELTAAEAKIRDLQKRESLKPSRPYIRFV